MEFFNPQNIHLYIAIFLSVLNGGVLCFSSSKFLQIIQQSGYHVSGYMSWLRGTRYKYLSRLFVLSLLSVACSLVTNSLFDVYHSQAIYSYLGLIFYFYFSGSFILNLVKEPNKTPLVKTKRITRTLTALFIVYTLVTFALIALSTEYFKLLRFGIITLTPVLVPFVVVLVFWILYPVEKLINIYYISKAKRKLKKSKDLVRVGITGSYAKTTNKFILTTMLSKKYKTLCSPHSYNTPLGLTRTILQDLDETIQVFVAEMGAKKKGEINELCKLVDPDHALLTGIGSQHLESFKSEENIVQTKKELADWVDAKGGYIVYNGENQKCKTLFEQSSNQNKILAGTNQSFCFATDVVATSKGIQFNLILDGKSLQCQTKLLGEYNLQNICMCASLAFKLGVSPNQIKSAIKSLSPAEHRMQLIPSGKNVVIDDSFNASAEGCQAALETLKLFDGYSKVIITPGIVEMGKYETETNFNFGKQIASVCDYVIIVNDVNKQSISQGLEQNNFDMEKVFCVENLEKAKEKITELKLENSVILFENDLPDLFSY